MIRSVSKKPPHAAVSIPADTTKVESISKAAKSIFESSPKKQVEMFEALKDRPREDVKRAITYLKAKAEDQPETMSRQPVATVVKEAFKAANVTVKITFDGKISKALINASGKRDLSWEDVVQMAVEDWLKRNKFL